MGQAQYKYPVAYVTWPDGHREALPNPVEREQKPDENFKAMNRLRLADPHAYMRKIVEKHGHLVKAKRKGETAQAKKGRGKLQGAFETLPVTDQDVQDVLTHARFIAGPVQDAYFGFLVRPVYGHVQQHHYRPAEFTEQNLRGGGKVPELAGKLNVYMTINSFYRPQRKTAYTRYLTAIGIDLDYKKVDKYAHLTHEEMLRVLDEEVFSKGLLPEPSAVIHAGNMQFTFLLNPTPYNMARKLWKAVVKHFVGVLKHYGADPKCQDFSRVLRLPGTYHPSGVRVTAEYRSDHRWELRDLERNYLPALDPDWQEQRKERLKRKRAKAAATAKAPEPKETNRQHRYSINSLNYQRAADLVRICELRGWDPRGHREELLFLYRYYRLKYHGDPERALEETEALNDSLVVPYGSDDPSDSVDETQSAETMWYEEKKPEVQAKARSMGYPTAGYNYTNEELMEMLEITPEEEQHLATIISEVEKKRRANAKGSLRKEQVVQRRREQGMMSREEYEAPARERREKAIALRQQGLSLGQIGKKLGCSKSEIARLLQGVQLEKSSVQGVIPLYQGALALGLYSVVSVFSAPAVSGPLVPPLAAPSLSVDSLSFSSSPVASVFAVAVAASG